MSQQVYTTVSRFDGSPPSAAAIDSSISANPPAVSPLPTRIRPELGGGDQLEVDGLQGPAALERLPVSASAVSRSAMR